MLGRPGCDERTDQQTEQKTVLLCVLIHRSWLHIGLHIWPHISLDPSPHVFSPAPTTSPALPATPYSHGGQSQRKQPRKPEHQHHTCHLSVHRAEATCCLNAGMRGLPKPFFGLDPLLILKERPEFTVIEHLGLAGIGGTVLSQLGEHLQARLGKETGQRIGVDRH